MAFKALLVFFKVYLFTFQCLLIIARLLAALLVE